MYCLQIVNNPISTNSSNNPDIIYNPVPPQIDAYVKHVGEDRSLSATWRGAILGSSLEWRPGVVKVDTDYRMAGLIVWWDHFASPQ